MDAEQGERQKRHQLLTHNVQLVRLQLRRTIATRLALIQARVRAPVQVLDLEGPIVFARNPVVHDESFVLYDGRRLDCRMSSSQAFN